MRGYLRPRTVHQLFTVTVLPLVVLREPAPGLNEICLLHNVIPAIDRVRLMATDRHRDLPWNSSIFHVTNRRSAKVMDQRPTIAPISYKRSLGIVKSPESRCDAGCSPGTLD